MKRIYVNREALLTSGAVIGLDIPVLAVGIRTNIFLDKEAAGQVKWAVISDEKEQTSSPEVCAVAFFGLHVITAGLFAQDVKLVGYIIIYSYLISEEPLLLARNAHIS